MRVLAVIVTYNRTVLLARCLDHLERQTRPPDEVLVVNNGSTDDTEAMLRSRGTRFLTQDNVGSAGGWHRGIQCAVEERFDAVWLMDDDGYPAPDALANLEAQLAPGVACVSSVVVHEDDPDRLVFPLPRLNAAGLPRLFGVPRKHATLRGAAHDAARGLFPFAHFFNGALVSVAAARAVGNVDRDFFIFGDELDYLHRLRRFGAVYSSLDALHFHPDVGGRPLTDVKIYYYVKNTLILNQRYHDWVPVRSALTVLAALGRTAARNGVGEAARYLFGSKRAILRAAITRGLRGHVAKDFHG